MIEMDLPRTEDINIMNVCVIETDFCKVLWSYNRNTTLEYWIREFEIDKLEAHSINIKGEKKTRKLNQDEIGIRPVIRIDEQELKYLIREKSLNPYLELLKKDLITFKDNILIKWGEYPKYFVSDSDNAFLEDLYSRGVLKETEKIYTYNGNLTSKSYNEMLYTSMVGYYKYIRTSYRGKPTWVQVCPVLWNLIKTNNEYKLVAENVLNYGAIDSTSKIISKGENVELLDIFKTLDIMGEEIFSGEGIEIKKHNIDDNKKENNKNEKETKLNKKDIIKAALESNVPIYLGGPENGPKSKLIELFDSNPEIVCLENANNESLLGNSVYSQESLRQIDIEPSWLRKLKNKCEMEPSKIHIICFEQIDSAPENIQNAVINIANKRKVNGIWELPQNARIIISGEDANSKLNYESFIRLNINPTIGDLLNWSKITETIKVKYKDTVEKPIHQSIYNYLADKNLDENINFIKWIQASKLMYTTDNPKILEPLLGREITKDFINFCQKQKNKKRKENQEELKEQR